MFSAIRILIIVFCFITEVALAAEDFQPGNSCNTVGSFITGNSPTSNGGWHFICDGSTWQLSTIFRTEGYVGINTNFPSTMLHVNTASAGAKGQTIQGDASQTANLTEWQNSSGIMMSQMSSDGRLGINSASGGVMLQVNTASAAAKGSVIRAYTSQMEWINRGSHQERAVR